MFNRILERHVGVQERGGHGRTFLGLALVVAGLIWGVGRLGWSIMAIEWSAVVWPVVVVFIGVLVLIKGRHNRTRRITKQEGI